ncbi:hypothetical protein AM587_10002609 [Phytophthora nicotianae]|nr:hypothetical protein AM587_10010668 [Phytophthora nicotianae]KUF78423.1 hypothetical protein AM588_10000057 [Phytophthora nicotianae]KUF81183.1 hypothetical protein AM587_10002609 [Phytophthora nicotianae]KUF86655.1 Phosphoenolpyruvate carboxykinase [Phytophthora nicotianae]KUF92062.1 hypothetical protein AM588_10006642 [Phytophthora nicotianae]
MVSNKNLSAFFYAPLGQGLFRCNICGSTRKQAGGTGYSNLIAHLDGKHAGYDAQYTAAQGGNDSPLESFGFVAEESSHLFQWIQWIIMRNMPVHEVEDAFTRAMSKLRPVTVKSVQKCMEGIAIKVGQQLEKELGELFGLMFDGWSHAGIHYVALFAVYEADGKLHVPLLGLSPLADGTQTADAHVQLFKSTLDVYNKTLSMVAFMVGDNCNTNRSIATKLGVPLVGCASHRFNLAVNKFLEPHEALLSDVNSLMVELRHENNLAELSKYTELLPVKRNVTRWSSTFTMVQRYIRIRSDIKKVEAVEELIPTGAKHRKLLVLFDHLKKFDSVCKRLQRDETDMAEVRLMFDALLTEYPVMAEHLRPTAKVVHTPTFESGVVKVITGAILSPAEELALKRFEVVQAAGKKRKKDEEDYASVLLRTGGKPRNQVSGGRSGRSAAYKPLAKLVPPTSNTVERLFSQCKLVLTPQRRGMHAARFEQLAFLRVNRGMWNVSTVASVDTEQNE